MSILQVTMTSFLIRKLIVVFLAVSLFVVLPIRSQDHIKYNDRVTRVLMGLRPPISIKGRPVERWMLYERMQALHIPGVSIAIIDGNRVVWAGGFGIKESGSTDSVKTSTLFQAQSISKPVATTAMLRLAESGRLSLDEDVNTYLKSWHLRENKFTSLSSVTLRKIVSHSAGLSVGGFPGYRLGDTIPTLQQILNGEKPANNAPIRVDTIPGSISRYSGGGLTLMQQLLEDITNKPFTTLMRELVLQPARMQRSTFEQPLPSLRWNEAASGHNSDGVLMKGRWPIHPEMAAAGLWTTPTDLANWILEITNAWRGRDNSLLSKQSALQMLTVQKPPFGLGVVLQGEDSSLSFGHSGANAGFRAEFLMYPSIGKGAVIMTNADLGGYLIDEILLAVASEFGWPAPIQSARTAKSFSADELNELIGSYSIPSPYGGFLSYDITRNNDRLYAELKGFFPKSELCATSSDTLFTVVGHNILVIRDDFGRIAKLSLNGQLEATRK